MWREIEDMLLRRKSFRLHRRFCDERIVDFHVRPTDGNGWVLTCERLTGKTAGEDAHHTAFLNQIIEHVNHGICVFDAGRNLVFCNEKYFQIYGCDHAFIKPGVSFRNTIRHGIRLGIYADDVPGNLDRELDAWFTQQEAVRRWTLADGRVIEMRIIPIEGGGWLTEHEDVTDSTCATNRRCKIATTCWTPRSTIWRTACARSTIGYISSSSTRVILRCMASLPKMHVPARL